MGWFNGCGFPDKGIRLLLLAQTDISQRHEIITVSAVSCRVILIKDQEFRKGNSEIFNLNFIFQVLLTVIDQPVETGTGFPYLAHLQVCQSLIEDHIRRLVIVIHGASWFIRAYSGCLVALCRFLRSTLRLQNQSQIIV